MGRGSRMADHGISGQARHVVTVSGELRREALGDHVPAAASATASGLHSLAVGEPVEWLGTGDLRRQRWLVRSPGAAIRTSPGLPIAPSI